MFWFFKKQSNISKFNNVKTVSLAFPKWVSKLLRGRVLLSSLWPLAPPHSNIVSTSSLQFSCANCSVVQLHTPANLSIWLSTQCWDTRRLSKQYSYSQKIVFIQWSLFSHTQSKQQRLLDRQKLLRTQVKDCNLLTDVSK